MSPPTTPTPAVSASAHRPSAIPVSVETGVLRGQARATSSAVGSAPMAGCGPVSAPPRGAPARGWTSRAEKCTVSTRTSGGRDHPSSGAAITAASSPGPQERRRGLGASLHDLLDQAELPELPRYAVRVGRALSAGDNGVTGPSSRYGRPTFLSGARTSDGRGTPWCATSWSRRRSARPPRSPKEIAGITEVLAAEDVRVPTTLLCAPRPTTSTSWDDSW